MSRDSKGTNRSKKSTRKYREFKTSPLIPVIAIIEVLVLIGVSTFAWYSFSANKQLGSGTISVEADSGLDIDFQYANKEDYINIWNYTDDDFAFEPVTSLDGRNVYIPTSGTFSQTSTSNMVFRDGTVNDINSKYLNIDFMLTNTSDYDMDIYLNNQSYFRVKDDQGKTDESRALRLAFYTNDGNSGNVGSGLISESSGTSTDGSDDTSGENEAKFYFDTINNTSWSRIYAYFYKESSGEYHTAWPGVEMSFDNGKVFSLSIDNDEITDYDKVIFTNGYSGYNNQTSAHNISDVKERLVNLNGDVYGYVSQTIYFLKPSTWKEVYCNPFITNNNVDSNYVQWPGNKMKYVGSGIYSYTLYYQYIDGETPHNNITKILFNNGSADGTNQTTKVELSDSTDGNLYYVYDTDSDSGNYSVTSFGKYSSLTYDTVYFVNSFDWTKPYAVASKSDSESWYTTELPMVSLSGNVYYCTIPSFYDRVSFKAKEAGNNNDLKTVTTAFNDSYVYRPLDSMDPAHKLESFAYSKYIQSSGYPVISPGVSVGFQRSYSPVVDIDSAAGSPKEIIPAFANSIDNYIYSGPGGSGKAIFTIKSKHMLSLSMVLWLEGTDLATFDDTYPGNKIDLRLEFATVTKKSAAGQGEQDVAYNTGESNYYTYDFYDKTREIWTANRRATESGITVAPVMQLFDNSIQRGYLMKPKYYTTYNNESKVSCWTVVAPASIALRGHDIQFRRVNPYNEDEVWNYWHPGPVSGNGSKNAQGEFIVADSDQEIYDIAFSGDNTISFTAFADGSPLKTMPGLSGDTDSSWKVPDESCGGLWGKHTVRTLTVFDGLRGQPLKDNKGVLTINYYYDYMVGDTQARNAHIEYKASSDNPFYYFIVPNVAYANSSANHCCFKRYTGFEDAYAINSEKYNPDIHFEAYHGKDSVISGEYFELTVKTNGEDYSYWGSDMLYIQTNNLTKHCFYTSSSENDSKPRLFQVHFWGDNTGDMYTFLHRVENFDGSGGYGYACVIPNSKSYSKFKLMNSKYDGSKTYNETHELQLVYDSKTDQTIRDPYTNRSITMKSIVCDKHIIRVTHVGCTVYLKTRNAGYQNDPYLYSFNSSNQNNGWPNKDSYSSNMDFVSESDGLREYKLKDEFNPLMYNKIVFIYNVVSSNTGNKSGDISVPNYEDIRQTLVYTNNDTGQWGAGQTYNDGGIETMRCDYLTDEPTSWPHE